MLDRHLPHSLLTLLQLGGRDGLITVGTIVCDDTFKPEQWFRAAMQLLKVHYANFLRAYKQRHCLNTVDIVV